MIVALFNCVPRVRFGLAALRAPANADGPAWLVRGDDDAFGRRLLAAAQRDRVRRLERLAALILPEFGGHYIQLPPAAVTPAVAPGR